MKILMMTMLAAMMMWCAGPERSSEKSAQNLSETLEETTSKPPAIGNGTPLLQELPKEGPFKKIRVNFKSNGQYYDKIEFWDESSRRLNKTVDLEALHPFNNLPFNETGITYGSKKYNLKDATPKQIEKYFGKLEIPENIADQVPTASDGQILAFDGPTMQDFTVVAYNIYLTNQYRQMLAIIAEYIAFNDKGEIIGRFRTNKAGETPVITQDGKYIAIKYGGTYDECGNGHLPEGLAFYESKNGKMIASDMGDSSWGNGVSIGEAYNKVLAAVYIGGSVQPNRYWVFDLRQGNKYYIEIFEKKAENRPIWEEDGAVFTKNGVRKKYYFDQDFQITHLQIEKQ